MDSWGRGRLKNSKLRDIPDRKLDFFGFLRKFCVMRFWAFFEFFRPC